MLGTKVGGVAIIGCGFIGRKRARALGGLRLVACCDVVEERARGLASGHAGCATSSDWRATVVRPDVDIVVVATTNDMLAPIRWRRRRPASTSSSRNRGAAGGGAGRGGRGGAADRGPGAGRIQSPLSPGVSESEGDPRAACSAK